MLWRSKIEYRDQVGQVEIAAEAMSSPWNEIVVYRSSIPDTPERSRADVLDRLRPVFDFVGWTLTLEEG